MKTRICAIVVLTLLAAACSTKGSRSAFDDIPLPTGLTYQPQRSVVIESPTIKAGQLVYRGRLEPESLGAAMRTQLEANGWRHVSRTSTASDGTRQIYEKDGNALEVHVYEGLWYTYLAIRTSRTLSTATAQTKDDAAQTITVTAPSEERIDGRTTAGLDVDGPATLERPAASDRPMRSADASFTQRVKDFFTGLFTW